MANERSSLLSVQKRHRDSLQRRDHHDAHHRLNRLQNHESRSSNANYDVSSSQSRSHSSTNLLINDNNENTLDSQLSKGPRSNDNDLIDLNFHKENIEEHGAQSNADSVPVINNQIGHKSFSIQQLDARSNIRKRTGIADSQNTNSNVSMKINTDFGDDIDVKLEILNSFDSDDEVEDDHSNDMNNDDILILIHESDSTRQDQKPISETDPFAFELDGTFCVESQDINQPNVNQSHFDDAKKAISTLFGTKYTTAPAKNNSSINDYNYDWNRNNNDQSEFSTRHGTNGVNRHNQNISHHFETSIGPDGSITGQHFEYDVRSDNRKNTGHHFNSNRRRNINVSLLDRAVGSIKNNERIQRITNPLQFRSSIHQIDSHLEGSQTHRNGLVNNVNNQRNAQLTIQQSLETNNNMNKVTKNTNTEAARAWFGGNLKSTPGSNLPSTVPSTSTFDNLNPFVHVVGSSSNLNPQLYMHSKKSSVSRNDRKSGTTIFDKSHWNWLNTALCLGYGFTTAANTVPVALIPTIAIKVLFPDEGDEVAASNFVSTVATYAVLGTAFGKFLNGSLGDIFGARRVACYFSLLHTFSLLTLSFSTNRWSIIFCCVAAEYYQSVQWPCVAVILAAHYSNGILGDENVGGNSNNDTSKNVSDGRYEKGIYIASLGSRAGALIANLSTTLLLRYCGFGWRSVARMASLSSFIGFVIKYLFVTDSPGKLHDPQNPIKGDIPDLVSLCRFYHNRYRNNDMTMAEMMSLLRSVYKFLTNVFCRNMLPSLRSVLSNGTFWVVAIAHSGGSMVVNSFRILGTYFRDTSYGVISENQAGLVTLFLSVGILFGLFFGGNEFSNLSNHPRARKAMIAKLYVLIVVMCYCLAFLAIPAIRSSIHSPYIIALFQAIATFMMGAGVAVQVYCIPAIVACGFGANKGLYASYTDGVAGIISSFVWRIMSNAVAEGNPQGSGWAYGWAAIALLVILDGFLMVEFVEYYFCRGGWISRLRDSNQRASFEQKFSSNQSLSDDSSISKLTQSGRRIWDNRPSLFRRISDDSKTEPDLNSIISTEKEDEEPTIIFDYELVNGLSNDKKLNNGEISSPSSVVDNKISVFDQAAPFDQNTINTYELFVRNEVNDSESGTLIGEKHTEEDDSVMSEDSDSWHISHEEQRGIDVYIDL